MARKTNNLLRHLIVVVMSGIVLQRVTSVGAANLDLHWLWHDRCSGCHGHSADFARKSLSVSGEQLQGRHYEKNLRLFLHNHYLSGHEVDAVYTMLLSQVKTQARFKDECSDCHGIAAEFVRNSLELRGGVLYGRDSGNRIRVFLSDHRDLSVEDIEYFDSLLLRIASEIYRP